MMPDPPPTDRPEPVPGIAVYSAPLRVLARATPQGSEASHEHHRQGIRRRPRPGGRRVARGLRARSLQPQERRLDEYPTRELRAESAAAAAARDRPAGAGHHGLLAARSLG